MQVAFKLPQLRIFERYGRNWLDKKQANGTVCLQRSVIGEIESEEEESTGGDHQKCSATEKYILRKAYFHAFLGVQILA